MFGYTEDARSFVITMTSASGVVERLMWWCVGTIYQTGQFVGVIMQESLLLIGLEFRYMCLEFRSQWISMRNPPWKQTVSIRSENGTLRGKAQRFTQLCRPYYVYGSCLQVSQARRDSYNVVKWTSPTLLSPSVIRFVRWKTYLRRAKYFPGLRIFSLRMHICTNCCLRKKSNSISLPRIPSASQQETLGYSSKSS